MKKCCTLKKENNTNVRLDKMVVRPDFVQACSYILQFPFATTEANASKIHSECTTNGNHYKVHVHCLNINLLI